MRINGNNGGNSSNMQTGMSMRSGADLQAGSKVTAPRNSHVGNHRVTDCIHNHDSELYGGVRVTIESGNAMQTNNAPQTPDTNQNFSLGSWISDKLRGVKKALGGIWNGTGEDIGINDGEDALATLESTGQGDILTGTETSESLTEFETKKNVSSALVAVAATGVQTPKESANNPYFSAISDTGKESETLWKRIKVKFHSVAGNLTNRFSFFGKNSFQTKQEQPREDLRKRSHYKEDDLEIDCMLTDDSYLLDSYDRKGEYSKLSTKK